MKSVKNKIKAFFYFNKRQERGAFVLIVLIIITFAFNQLLPVIIKEKTYDFSSTLQEINAWKKSIVENPDSKPLETEDILNKSSYLKSIRLNPIPFNPNKYPEEKWIEMGMPKHVVKNILKYENSGGSFKKKEDLQKIYGLKPELYKQIEDFILIPEKKQIEETEGEFKTANSNKSKTTILLDINRIDSVGLLQVPGIGPFYAGQIISYRNRLGGYHSIGQLMEIYKMDSLRFQSFLPYLTMKDTVLGQIDLNAVDFKTLLRHPYIDYETTKKIINLRYKLGRFAGMYQLKNDTIVSDSLFKKVAPYLKID